MKKSIKDKNIHLINQWWFYPILWFVCVFILALMSDSRSSGDTFYEDFIFFSYMLPGFLIILQFTFLNFIKDDNGILSIIIYYTVYIVGFSILPFVKKKWKQILIGFLLFWILTAFIGCSFFGGFRHSDF